MILLYMKEINLGNQKSALEVIETVQKNDYVPFDIKIHNSHITELNKTIGKTIFRKDALYISSRTLWEIMQPVGGKGKHHFHGLTPYNVLDSLIKMKYSRDIIPSYDGRYLIITVSFVYEKVPLAIVIDPKGTLNGKRGNNVAKIVTIYPYNKK